MTLDFSDAGLPPLTVRRIAADGETLLNAFELIEQSPTRQVIVCETCGYTGCERGGGVRVRRDSNHLLLLPPIPAEDDAMAPPEDLTPPRYFVARGLPVISIGVAVRALGEDWVYGCPRLRFHDVWHALQWMAPFQVLGEMPHVLSLDAARLLATSHGSVDEQVDALRLLLATNSDAPAELHRREQREDLISFYLDDDASTDWRPLVQKCNSVALSFGDEFVVPS